MSIKKAVGLVSVVALLGAVFACTSTTTNNTTTGGGDDGGTDSKAPPKTDAAKDSSPIDTPDTGTKACAPDLPASWTPTYHAAALSPGKCTETQLADYRKNCYNDETASQQACSQWVQASANKECFKCTYSMEDEPTWSADLVFELPGIVELLNHGGCMEAFDSSSLACAKKVQASFQCAVEACRGSCTVPDSQDKDAVKAARTEFSACLTASRNGPCKQYAADSQTCLSALGDAGAARIQPCFDRVDNDDAVAIDAIFKVYGKFCGPATSSDAGSDTGHD